MPEYLPKLAAEVPPPAVGRLREKRKIKDIEPLVPYDAVIGQFGSVNQEPTQMGIRRAVDDQTVELREYDDQLRATLGGEAALAVGFNPQGCINFGPLIREFQRYHEKRIAYFVLNEWTNPIIGLNEDGKLCDGGHRFRAAIFMGWDEVWVDYPEPVAAAPAAPAQA